MGIISVDTAYGAMEFEISGDAPTQLENDKIREIVSNPKPFFSEIDQGQTSAQGSDQSFDTTTGIQDAGLRASLSIADKFEEQEAVLQKNGLNEEDYTKDNRGQLALTPSGAIKFGIETDKNIVIDERGLSKNDISDLAGIAPEIGGAVTGAVVGQALIPIPILGAMIGAAIGGGGANLIEEFYEMASGVSRQTPGEIAKQTGKEALLSGAFEGGGQILFKTIGKAFSPGGSKLSPEDLKLMGESIEMGITPTLSTLGASPVISRQQALAERIFKSSPRLKRNFDVINSKIEKFREKAGASDVNELGRILKEAADSGNTKLLQEEARLSKDVISFMTKAADNLDRAAVQDLAIDDNLFSVLSQSFKHFDDLSVAGFKKIDEINKSVVGNADIIPSGSLKALVDDFGGIAKYDNIIPNTSQDLEKTILTSMSQVGEKSSFAKLYSARKSLSDTKMTKGAEQGVYNMANKFIDEIDTILSRKNLEGIENIAFRNIGSGAGSRKKILSAADSVQEQRRLFAEGMRQFDALEHSSILKDIANTVRNNKPIDASRMQASILKPDAPERLISLKKVLDNQAERMNAAKKPGAKSVVSEYENLRSRMAGEWLRKNIDESASILDPTKFKGEKFAKAYKALGTTADELFGSKAPQVKKLSEQMNALSLSNLDQRVIGLLDEGSVFADDGINLLQNLVNKRKSINEFQRSSLVKKLRDGTLDDVEAAAYISNPNTKPADVAQVMNYFKDDASKEVLKGAYMDDLIGNFDAKFLTDPTQFRTFGDKLIKDNAKISEIFGEEMSKEMLQFGKILKLNAKAAEGGELIAASIAASPLQNVGKLLKFTLLGRMFSSEIFYKRFMKDYRLLTGQGITKKEAFADLLSKSVSQIVGQTSAKGISSGVEQTKSLVSNAINSQKMPQQRPSMPVPNVAPGEIEGATLSQIMSNISAPQANQSAIRQRAAQNPAVASSLLGGLGSADLL